MYTHTHTHNIIYICIFIESTIQSTLSVDVMLAKSVDNLLYNRTSHISACRLIIHYDTNTRQTSHCQGNNPAQSWKHEQRRQMEGDGRLLARPEGVIGKVGILRSFSRLKSSLSWNLKLISSKKLSVTKKAIQHDLELINFRYGRKQASRVND